MSVTTKQTKTPVTAKNAMFTYYDIESLANVFTLCAFTPRTNALDVFFLVEPGSDLDDEIRKNGGIDVPKAAHVIREANPAYEGKPLITFYDLSYLDNNKAMAKMFGLSNADLVNDKKSASDYDPEFRLVCDTDPEYDPIDKHPYLAGYNSYNYDTTMLAVYLMEAFADVSIGRPFKPVSPKKMRDHNDQLFTEAFKSYMPRYLTQGMAADGDGRNSVVNKIRAAMISSGRHIDVARLNEKQQRVGLKRLLGMMGRQILESEQLGGHNSVVRTLDQLYDLLAYNVSDVVNLDKLFQHPLYSGAFDLKKGLLDEYPETVYDRQPGTQQPDIKPWRVRRGRLSPDSTSAKFVALVLSPYGNLPDIEAVSFDYPSEMVAKERGIERVNVLEETKKFFYENITDEDARRQFDHVYNYYKSIEGKNFNSSDSYHELWTKEHGGNPNKVKPLSLLADIPKAPNNLPYFYADGTPSSCFATFSTGGIHGAEADLDTFVADLSDYVSEVNALALAKQHYPDPKDLLTEAKAQLGLVELPDGTVIDYRTVVTGVTSGNLKYKGITKNTTSDAKDAIELAQHFYPDPADLMSNVDLKKATMELPDGTVIEYKKTLSNTTLKNAAYRDAPQRNQPTLFVEKADGSTRLHGKYVYTSADEAIHEDFSSYYPLLLTNMSAFYNPDLGDDRYLKIFHDKERYGKMMKDKSISADEREMLGVLRNGTKLILNSASGAGDASHDNPIRVNNQIISMRIIGQLFSWRVGQAQTLAGARIISTNTDGLYSVLDEETNNRVLEEQAAIINVEIEPEAMLLVSKDSNNRLELKRTGDQPWETKIVGASGGSLACHRGPNPDKSLAHPAITDHALAEYLRLVAVGYQPDWASEPLTMKSAFDRRLGMAIIDRALREMDPVHAAMMFQNIISASVGSISYPFASDAVEEADEIGEDSDGAVDSTKLVNPRALQHYNRVFVVKTGVPGAVNLRTAGAWKVTAASAAKRHRDGAAPRQIDPIAKAILASNGLTVRSLDARINNMEMLPSDEDIVVRKINGIDPSWPMLVINRDLHHLDKQHLQMLLACLDLDVYNEMTANAFEANWRNRLHDADATVLADEDADADAA